MRALPPSTLLRIVVAVEDSNSDGKVSLGTGQQCWRRQRSTRRSESPRVSASKSAGSRPGREAGKAPPGRSKRVSLSQVSRIG
ncbi:hypothetical protein DIPPA_10682 [Diplonema papillatum]|nr:hypothetical protein DIPPA_10682 [Diplonema papillatum]